MTRYIKCSRLNGLVIDDSLAADAGDLVQPNLFWVAVEPNAQGGGDWQRRHPNDVVIFSPLPSFADNDPRPIVPARQGAFQHQIDAAAPLLKQRERQDQDTLMRARLDQWCMSQPEGNEQAFLDLGRLDPASPRYRAYQQALLALKREHGL
ncbi:hypothetical protein BUE93_21810 [Chromobacterium amazonense]|uniref:Uncharacterized protein n=1 Tax=Chromobacterium amazonense TaxID=1382803 RepID=A0A2S9WYI0_9NEIS|nr:hypothetical protein [Chromobacterium amazonense]PRP68529.1 hypothetical protein BUE93_21810 [Chromobacterium amazonense]